MIDICSEELVLLSKAGEKLPKNHKGKVIKRGTIRRWTTVGRRGVFLDYTVLGGLIYTSVEALQRFADAQTELDLSKMRPKKATIIPPSQRKAIAAAEAGLRAAGLMK